MFFVTSLLCDTEAKTSAVWSLISEKSISVIVLSDFNQGSIFEATNIKFRVKKFYPLGWVGRGGGWNCETWTARKLEIILKFYFTSPSWILRWIYWAPESWCIIQSILTQFRKNYFSPSRHGETDRKRNKRWEISLKNALLVVSLLHQSCRGFFSDERRP